MRYQRNLCTAEKYILHIYYCVIDELKCHNLCLKYLPFSLTIATMATIASVTL